MFGSKVVCCSPGEHLVLSAGLQAASNTTPLTTSTTSPLATANARFVCSAAAAAASKTSSSSPPCLRPSLITSSQLRRPLRRIAFEKGSSLQCPSLLSIRVASQPRPRFFRQLTTSCESISPSLPLLGRAQFHSRIRLCRVLNADANPEVEIDVESEENEQSPEVKLWTENEEEKNVAPHVEQAQHHEQQQQTKQKKLRNRIVFGFGIGAAFIGIILAGGWVFTLAFAWVIWIGTGEYFELLRSKGNVASGMTPPPHIAEKICAAICSLMPIMTLYFNGRMGVVVTTSAFGLATVLLLQKKPRFAQLTSAIFGLIYCGYLPSFWIKLRCGLSVPALNTRVAAGWPILFGGQAHWTVGLVATFVSCCAVAAADVFAYLGGKTFGKTPLISISPKKTLEGAAVGLGGSVAVTILLSKLLQWPSSTPSAAVLGVLVFMASLFGDLTESMMKRDAGVKDSGQLIPGHENLQSRLVIKLAMIVVLIMILLQSLLLHLYPGLGGVLDRVDSYIFTGALVYSFVKIGVPLFGV